MRKELKTSWGEGLAANEFIIPNLELNPDCVKLLLKINPSLLILFSTTQTDKEVSWLIETR